MNTKHVAIVGCGNEGEKRARALTGVCYEFADDDLWEIEIKEFLKDIALRRSPAPGLSDAIAALHVVRSVYGRGAAAADH